MVGIVNSELCLEVTEANKLTRDYELHCYLNEVLEQNWDFFFRVTFCYFTPAIGTSVSQ
jgi:hypothetical protein